MVCLANPCPGCNYAAISQAREPLSQWGCRKVTGAVIALESSGTDNDLCLMQFFFLLFYPTVMWSNWLFSINSLMQCQSCPLQFFDLSWNIWTCFQHWLYPSVTRAIARSLDLGRKLGFSPFEGNLFWSMIFQGLPLTLNHCQLQRMMVWKKLPSNVHHSCDHTLT